MTTVRVVIVIMAVVMVIVMVVLVMVVVIMLITLMLTVVIMAVTAFFLVITVKSNGDPIFLVYSVGSLQYVHCRGYIEEQQCKG